MNLSQRMNGRYKDDSGAGFRANTADFGMSMGDSDRGGTGAESDEVTSSSLPGNPHSASGFKRALMRSGHQSNSVVDGINKRDFSLGQNRKPSYFGQGQRRHGMHIGSGAPAVRGAAMEGADSGGTD